jgi:hypothetical protein
LDEVSRRAGGRRRYNSWRKCIREFRRLKVWQLLERYSLARRGSGAAIARELGVHPATVSRDLAALREKLRGCPQCGQLPRPAAAGERDDDGMVEQVLAELQAEGRWAARGPLPRSEE